MIGWDEEVHLDNYQVIVDGHASSPGNEQESASTSVGYKVASLYGGVSGNETPAVGGEFAHMFGSAVDVGGDALSVSVHLVVPCCRARKIVVGNLVKVVRLGRSQRRMVISS